MAAGSVFRRPSVPNYKYDFCVLYYDIDQANQNPDEEDGRRSLAFVEKMVEPLESMSTPTTWSTERSLLKGYYAARDLLPGSMVINAHFRVLEQSRYTFVVLSPAFIRDCWSEYIAQSAFKELIGSQRFVPLAIPGVNASDAGLPTQLNVASVLFFREGESPVDDQRAWSKVISIVLCENPRDLEETSVQVGASGPILAPSDDGNTASSKMVPAEEVLAPENDQDVIYTRQQPETNSGSSSELVSRVDGGQRPAPICRQFGRIDSSRGENTTTTTTDLTRGGNSPPDDASQVHCVDSIVSPVTTGCSQHISHAESTSMAGQNMGGSQTLTFNEDTYVSVHSSKKTVLQVHPEQHVADNLGGLDQGDAQGSGDQDHADSGDYSGVDQDLSDQGNTDQESFDQGSIDQDDVDQADPYLDSTYQSSVDHSYAEERIGFSFANQRSVVQGSVDQGTADQGTADQGTADQGTADQGTADQGSVDQGTADQGTADQGTADQGSIDQGSTDQGSIDQGTSDQGSVDQGTADQGTSDQGFIYHSHGDKERENQHGVTVPYQTLPAGHIQLSLDLRVQEDVMDFTEDAGAAAPPREKIPPLVHPSRTEDLTYSASANIKNVKSPPPIPEEWTAVKKEGTDEEDAQTAGNRGATGGTVEVVMRWSLQRLHSTLESISDSLPSTNLGI